jgi:hypothetical protein
VIPRIIAFSLIGLCLFACKPKQQAVEAKRTDWNTDTTLGAYEKVGSKNPKWDADAKSALAEYVKIRAGITNYEQRVQTLNLAGTYAGSAIDHGCDDPLVEYIYCRFNRHISKKDLTQRLCETADKMQSSGYPTIRKFFANLNAAIQLWSGRNRAVWDRVAQYQTAAINQFAELAQDKNTPLREISECGQQLVANLVMEDWALKMIIDSAEPALDRNWPETDSIYALKANLYYNYAWCARGGGYAYKVSEEGWKGFRERLAISHGYAEKAWTLNPKNTVIPTLMIKLAEGMQKPRAEMEQWFSKAMELEPNNYDACQCKLHYLYPQWYGSAEEMIQFGRECVASDVWTGTVPLILVEAHDQIAAYLDAKEQKAYWKRPDVWKDIASAYDRFFEKNPDGIGWHHNYVWYAYKCEQWDTLNQQLKLLGDVNYAYFGGEEQFDKIVAAAKEHAEENSGK